MLACVLALTLGVAAAAPTTVPAVDMAEVRRLAREPVDTILSGAPVQSISAKDYRTIFRSQRPVIVVFYANQEQKSRNLATLVRYLALEFNHVIAFYGYRVTAGASVEKDALTAIHKHYGVKHVPATLFYDNDRGPMELEKADYSVPTLAEYRTPNLLFWTTYHHAVRDYIQKSILD